MIHAVSLPGGGAGVGCLWYRVSLPGGGAGVGCLWYRVSLPGGGAGVGCLWYKVLLCPVQASTFPTVVVYVMDVVRSVNPVSFMSNMLYACR